jgi:hypothetical protein
VTNGNAATAPDNPVMQNGMRKGGTTGVNSGSSRSTNSSPQAHQPSTTGPSPQAPVTSR